MVVLDSGGGGSFTLIRVNFIGGLATCTVRFADGETQNIWQMANVTSNKKKTKHINVKSSKKIELITTIHSNTNTILIFK